MPLNYAPKPQGSAADASHRCGCETCGLFAAFKPWGELYAEGWRQIETEMTVRAYCPQCVSHRNKPETKQGATMQINISIERSDAWVKQQRLDTGENTAQTTQVAVNPAELSRKAREVLLTYHNQYTNIAYFGYSREYQPGVHFSFGRERFYCDAMEPTVEEVNDAILAAWQRIAAKRAESERLQAEKKAEEAAKAALVAELEQKKAEARELLADELALLVPKREVIRVRGEARTLGHILQVLGARASRGDFDDALDEAGVNSKDYDQLLADAIAG